MTLRFPSMAAPLTLVASLVLLSGCAGSKPHSSSASSDDSSSSSSASEPKASKLDDARRSAEDAEGKAHQLREEKNRTQSKTSAN